MSEEKQTETAELDVTLKLGQAFDIIIKKQYGHLIAPEPIVTPFGITHLDALLGGGLVSSGPVMISSTPETGKSTAAYQFSSVFQNAHKNGIIVYLDVEGAGSKTDNESYRVSRAHAFGLDEDRFKYQSIVLNVQSVFELVESLVDLKKQFEAKVGKEFYICVVWDSIASTPSSKAADAEDANKIIGHKARQLTFCLDKYGPMFKFHKITFICIDQIRANLKIDGPYVQQEKSVGFFKDIKAATNIYALQH